MATAVATNGHSADAGSVTIRALNTRRVLIPVKGVTELICHAWGAKAVQEMEDAQTGVTKKRARGAPREAKNPTDLYHESMYVVEEDPARFESSVFGFPSVAFKAAMVRAAKAVGMAMTDARTALFIEDDLVVIEGEPYCRRDMVRLQGKTADVRYRGAFKEWSAVLPIIYDADLITLDDVVNLVHRAGFSVGVGEWRPERDGPYGRFAVVHDEVNNAA